MFLPHNNAKDFYIPLALLMAGAYLLFANTFGNAWLLDDLPVIVENPDIRSLREFFRDSYPGRPLREITFLFDHALFGLKPAGYHIQHIFWHGLNAFLIFVLMMKLQGGKTAAWIASLLFLVHPIQVEVVGNISHRKDSLALAFSLLALLAYVEAFRPGRKRLAWLAGAFSLAFVAYQAKQNAVVLPLLFGVYEAVFLPPQERWLLKSKRLVAGLVAGGAAIFTAWFFWGGGLGLHLGAMRGPLLKINYHAQPSEMVYFLVVLKGWAFMFLRLLLPVNLSPEYVFEVPGSWLDPWVLSALAGLVLYGLSLWWSCRRWPLAFLALAWIGLFWLPTSNIWPLSYFAADRYMYTPSAGFCVLLAGCLGRLFEARAAVLAALVLPVLVLLSVMTWQQNKVWQTPLALWTQAVKVSPRSTWALNNLGTIHLYDGNYAKAIELYQDALKNFNDSRLLYNLGAAYEGLGDRQKALHYFQMFLSVNDPRFGAEARTIRQHLRQRYGVTTD